MTIKQAQYSLIQYLWRIRNEPAYRLWAWQLTPKKWVRFNRAYDIWEEHQLTPMPVPREYV